MTPPRAPNGGSYIFLGKMFAQRYIRADEESNALVREELNAALAVVRENFVAGAVRERAALEADAEQREYEDAARRRHDKRPVLDQPL